MCNSTSRVLFIFSWYLCIGIYDVLFEVIYVMFYLTVIGHGPG